LGLGVLPLRSFVFREGRGPVDPGESLQLGLERRERRRLAGQVAGRLQGRRGVAQGLPLRPQLGQVLHPPAGLLEARLQVGGSLEDALELARGGLAEGGDLLGARADGVGRGEGRLGSLGPPGRLGQRRRRGGGLQLCGLGVPGQPVPLRLERGHVGQVLQQPGRVALAHPGVAPGRGTSVVHRLDPQQAQDHLLALGLRQVAERVELLLLGEDAGSEHLAVHVEQPPDLGVHLGYAVGQHRLPERELRVGGVVLALDLTEHPVLGARVLEGQHHPALGERARPLRTDLLLGGPGELEPVQAHPDGLHEGRLPGAVGPEHADHPGRQLEVHLLEHPVVPQRELQDSHYTASPRADSR
jgi:hypothetical protein